MSENTTHTERVRITVDDAASASLNKIQSAFHGVSHSAETVGDKVKEFAHHAALGALGGVGLSLGFEAIADKAKEANLEQEHASQKIAGVGFAFTNWKAGTSAVEKWSESMEDAHEVLEKLEESEGKLKITRADLAQIYSSSYAIGARYNQSQEQMLDLTEKLGAAQKVLGVDASMASMIMARGAMTGTLGVRDAFSRMVRGNLGDMKAFHKMTEVQRFERMKKAMGDLVPAAQEMGKTMEGAMFDINKDVSQAFRDLTGPLFAEKTKSLREFAKHITEIQANGKSIMQEYGEKLVTAFHMMQKATAFIADHWKLIAASWLAMKAGGGLAGLAGGMATGGIGLGTAAVDYMSTFRLGVNGSTASLATFAGKLVMGVGALAGFYVALQGGAKMLDEWQTGKINREARWGAGSGLSGSEGSRAARKMEAFIGQLNGEGFQTDYKDARANVAAKVSVVRQGERVLPQAGRELGAFGSPGAHHFRSYHLPDRVWMATAKEAMTAYQAAYGTDVVSKAGVNRAGAREAFETMSEDARMRQLSGLGLPSTATGEQFVSKLDEMVKLLIGLLPTVEKEKRKVTDMKPPVTNIGHVSITQEFKEADPDRVFHKIVRDIDAIANTPTTSSTGLLASTGGSLG